MGLNLIWLLTMFMSTLHWLTNGQGWTDNKTSQSVYQEIFLLVFDIDFANVTAAFHRTKGRVIADERMELLGR